MLIDMKIARRADFDVHQRVARKLFQTYLQQIFIDGFFHADPHPGNLFVQPLDAQQAQALGIPETSGVSETPEVYPRPEVLSSGSNYKRRGTAPAACSRSPASGAQYWHPG